MHIIKRFYNYLTEIPPADILALQELHEAEREILVAKSALEYAETLVDYHTKRINRLKGMMIEK